MTALDRQAARYAAACRQQEAARDALAATAVKAAKRAGVTRVTVRKWLAKSRV